MFTFTVAPTTLRSTAITVDAAAEAAVGAEEVAQPAPLGHAALSGAIAAFVSASRESWRARVKETTAVAEGLRAAARRYEAADENGLFRMGLDGGGAF